MDQISSSSTRLTNLTRATSRIARARSPEDIVEAIRSTARSLIGCEGIAIVRREGDLCHYIEEDAVGPLWKGYKFQVSACVSGWSMVNRQTVVIPDVSADERVPFEVYRNTFVKSLAMAPIRAEEPVGAIGAYWSSAYEPSDWDVGILEALAEAAAVAIDNIEAPSGPAEARGPARSLQAAGVFEVEDFAKDIDAVAGIAAVPVILDVVLRLTGMGFAAVARVTETRWIACQTLDHVQFGLKPGDELPIESTFCNEIRDHRQPIVFDHVDLSAEYRDHHTPRIYGLKSYISVPIILRNGTFWGTLCAIDANPAKVTNPQILGSFKLFAELIAHHLDADERLTAAETSLEGERELSEVREQFIAVLGHDLRNPIAAVDAGLNRLLREGWTERTPMVLKLMKSSVSRMSGLVDNIMDLARARLGGGIVLDTSEGDLSATLRQVIDEIRSAYPERTIDVALEFAAPVVADHLRLAQMFSNLVSNAVTHGAEQKPITILGKATEKRIEISIGNGGEPISEDKIGKLFQPFQRGEAKPGIQGLGLGLYIASQIAAAHGGNIEVRSDETETRFTVGIPVGPAAL